jgi:NAD(P)-dependent dehydrogenase (short-subunit alcohol dehydrogenase family)
MTAFQGTVVVTGATSGIGRATALRFAAPGVCVVCVGRRVEALDQIAAAVRERGAEAVAIQADCRSPVERERLVTETLARSPRIDGLVNAAGVIASGNIESTSLVDFEAMLNLNVTACLHLIQLCLPALSEHRGSVVNVSSVAGLRSFPGILAYSVSKAALDQLTRCVALEVAGRGVRVNAVNPGVVVSELHRRGGMDESAYAAFLERSKATHPLGRPGEAVEVADLIHFLASPDACWITGVTYSIDGGRALTCAR